MEVHAFVAKNREQFSGLPLWHSMPRGLHAGDVVGDGSPSYVVLTEPEVDGEVVTAKVMYYPDGGRGVREWPNTDICVVPVVGHIDDDDPVDRPLA